MRRQRLALFTLLEMLAVLMILMIVMLLAALSFRNDSAANNAESHAAELLKFISARRGRALQQHEQMEISYDTDRRRWSSGESNLQVPDGLEVRLNGKAPVSGTPVFVFYPDGRAKSVHLELTGPDSYSGIVCSPVSGIASITKQSETEKQTVVPLWQKDD